MPISFYARTIRSTGDAAACSRNWTRARNEGCTVAGFIVKRGRPERKAR
jgi:hypothetical protein